MTADPYWSVLLIFILALQPPLLFFLSFSFVSLILRFSPFDLMVMPRAQAHKNRDLRQLRNFASLKEALDECFSNDQQVGIASWVR
jgi:hypothetical protein